MPFNKSSKQTYCQVPNNDFDLRIPLHSDESFQHGIVFQAKVSTWLLNLLVCRNVSRQQGAIHLRQVTKLFGNCFHVRWEFSSSYVEISATGERLKADCRSSLCDVRFPITTRHSSRSITRFYSWRLS